MPCVALILLIHMIIGILRVSGSIVSQVVSVVYSGRFGWLHCMPSNFIINILKMKPITALVHSSYIILQSVVVWTLYQRR